MQSSRRVLQVFISVVTILSTVLGTVPWAPVTAVRAAENEPSPYLYTTNTYLPVLLRPLADRQTTGEPPYTIYLPITTRNYQPPAHSETTLEPGIGGVIGSSDGQIRVTFSSGAITQTTIARYAPAETPSLPPNHLGTAGPGFTLTAGATSTHTPLTYFPYTVTTITDVSPWYSTYKPSIVISMTYKDTEIWGLDLSVLSLYRHNEIADTWVKVPTAVYPEQKLIVAETDTLGTFVPMSRLSINAPQDNTSSEKFSAQDDVSTTDSHKKLVLDPDDDEGHAYWDNYGYQREGTYNVLLAQATKQRLEADKCRVDVLLTRESDSVHYLSRATRAQMAREFKADMFTTFAFNALYGTPWGWQGDGGSLVWSGPDADDQALGHELLSRIAGLGRPYKWGTGHPLLPYTEFTALPGVYAHFETLYLDHNYDWPVIRTGFDAIADATYSAIRSQLEAQGMICGDDPNNPPPYPEPPSAELVQRWRDLGYQNYQRYGADPVSFSTGNHVVQARLTRIPTRGGLDWDLTLTYNSQDTRSDLLGNGWSFPYNARIQTYTDDSVTIALWDGRTYHYTWNGSDYDTPDGAFDRLEKTNIGWQWITPNNVTLTFSETVGGFGILTEWRDRNDNALNFSYDLSGQNAWQEGNEVLRPPLTAIHDDAGRTINVTSSNSSQITRLDLWDGRAYTFEYDDADNLTRITGPDGTLRRFEYDARNRIIKEWDAEDILFLQSVYDDRDRAVEQIDASGTHSYLSYDVANRQTIFTDNAGNTEIYTWDDLNRITDTQDTRGSSVSNTYDADYNLIARTDANGNTTRYDYDKYGNMIARYDPIPEDATYTRDVTRWAYDDHNHVISMTNALGHTWRYEYDASGNLIRSINPDGSETRATYNPWGQPTSITDAEGRSTTYEYNSNGDLIKTTHPDSTFSTSTYDVAGRETAYTDAKGHTVEFEHDGRDNITRIIDPKDVNSLFEYDSNDLLIRAINRLNNERLYRYDENLKLIAERDEEGLWTYYEYDELYRRVAMTDTAGFVTRYSYDEAGRLTTTTDSTGATTRYAHDDNNNIVAATNALHNTTRMIYDAANRLTYLIDAKGNRTEYCYDAEDQLVRTIGPRGEVTDYTYDALGHLITVKDPLGNATHYEYDKMGNRTATIDPMDERTNYTYNTMGRLTSIAAPELSDGTRATAQFGYDAIGNTLVITSPNGFATTFSYDDNDNITTITDPLGGQTHYTYDAEDTPLTVTNANNHTQSTTYNKVGLPVLVEDAMGYTTTLRYDDAYNMVEMVNAMGQSTHYDYDPTGQLRRLTDPLNNTTVYDRDALGRVTEVTNANGHATAYSYDALGKLITVTDALSGTTAYAYDAVGNLTVITDANQSITRFEYNFLNQLKREINPLGKTWEYWYDAAGHLVRRRDALWHATYYDYDSNGRLAEISYGMTAETMHPVTFTYDLESNETQMCDGLGCTAHTYDPLNRPVSTTDWLGRIITQTYDVVGNLTGLTYPNGYETAYEYNAANWLTALTDPHGESSTYTHNPLGQVTEIHHPNNTVATFTYDNAGRLTGIDNRKIGAEQPQSAYQYAMDKVGNRTQVIETRAAFDGSNNIVELVHTYDYDALDRLVSAATDTPASTTNYTFDAVGNRLGKTGTVLLPDAGVPELPIVPQPEQNTYTYNAANQLTEVRGQKSVTSLDYNANGDRIHETEVLTDGTTLLTDYRYDHEDRLIGATKTLSDSMDITVTMVATYTYDGYGRRAIKEVTYPANITPTQVVTYLYDGLEIIGAQLAQNSTVTETYYYLTPSPITGLRRPMEMERLPNPATGFAGDHYWYQSDGLDSVVALTDESGDLASPFLYDEYGQILEGTTELQVFAYTAQDYDVETGLVHFYARYYDPSIGIWLTQDPYRGSTYTPRSKNRYTYTGNTPTSNIDFYGFDRIAANNTTIKNEQNQSAGGNNTQVIEDITEGIEGNCNSCVPTQVWFGIWGSPTTNDCSIYFHADSDALLGGVKTVSIIQPLRDVPILGQVIESGFGINVLSGIIWGEKIGAQIAAGNSIEEIAHEFAYDLLMEIIGSLGGEWLKIPDGWKQDVFEIALSAIADPIKDIIKNYIDVQNSASKWEHNQLPHIVSAESSIDGHLEYFPNFEKLLEKYPGASNIVQNENCEYYCKF